MPPYLEMRDVVKEFPGVRALDGMSLSVEKGRILALCGENGAGKSTLMKVLSGIYPHGEFEGEILINGEPARFRGTKDAERAGVAIIHQELNLLPELTVAENIHLGREDAPGGVIDWAECHRTTEQLLESYNFGLDPQFLIRELQLGQMQLVEIAKALAKKAEILVLDEPTSTLSDREVEKLFTIMRDLKSRGVTMIYISHKLDEIRRICDEVAVIRDGKSVLPPTPVAGMTKEEIVRTMVGREITTLYPNEKVEPGRELLKVHDWIVIHPLLPGEFLVDNVNFEVRAGEVLGIYGLMGSGRTEVLTSIFGGFPPEDYSGDLFVCGTKVSITCPLDAINAGIALVTGDRKLFGLILNQSVGRNIDLPSLPAYARKGVIDECETGKLIERLIGELKIKTPSPDQLAVNLSGGNQQKVVLAKWLARSPMVLMLDEPTRGVDIGAKAEIYGIITELKKRGVGIVMVTSELPELMGMCDRVMVMQEGRPAGTFDMADVTAQKIGALATGNA